MSASTTYRDVRACVRRLQGSSGAIDTGHRIDVMSSLLHAVVMGANYGSVDPAHLVRLAAHAIAWADALANTDESKVS